MNSAEIRRRFLAFFASAPRNHAIIPSAPLVPENDPSVLFNTAGMQPLVPYLLGEKHPKGTRLANFQKCVRTGDIDDIGDNTHATFFEMMGNWSLGDYFKKEAIQWSYELLTDKENGFGLDPQRLYVTCFEGNDDAPRDEESAAIWKEIFDKNCVTGNRIFFLPAKNNWWSPGDNGPCGPDTEMFYDVTGNHASGLSHEEFWDASETRQDVVEIWNDVFMEFQKKDGKVVGKLAAKNVDTGSGFERVAMVLQGKNNIFDTDIFGPICAAIRAAKTSNAGESADNDKALTETPEQTKAVRIIADHIRTAVMLISDGVLPANTDQGYVLRRLIRRAVRFADVLALKPKALFHIADAVCDQYADVYENVAKQRETIKIAIEKEEQKFRNTLNRGMSAFERYIRATVVPAGTSDDEKERALNSSKTLNRDATFELVTSHGFPIELVIEIAKEKGIKVDLLAFAEDMEKHQELSRAGAGERFKGGLGDTSEMSVRYHTATHLLHQALREVLGDHVAQKGSNITPERLRFDFAHTTKMTDEEKKRVEDIVNEKIEAALPVQIATLSKEDAEKTGALHFFGEKYGDTVTVYFVGESMDDAFSKEFCGGPHVKNTSELTLAADQIADGSNTAAGTRRFKIQKEEAVAQGVRRIKAVLA